MNRGVAMTAPRLVWRNAGEPTHKYREESYGGLCATCGTKTEVSISTDQINNPTFANHAEFFRYGTHACRACAWLYGDPKRTHRNVLAAGEELWWPMISIESATEERPSWLELLRRVAEMPPETLVAGVLTSDPKPRNWPRMRLATVADFGLYVHAPDYDTSVFRSVSLADLLVATEPILEALRRGFLKTRIYSGLLADYAKAKKDLEGTMRLEEELRAIRNEPEFVPALLVSGIKKEEKDGGEGRVPDREQGRAGPASGAIRAGEARGQVGEDDHRLF